MGKFFITEEEKKQILSLYEQQTEVDVNSPKGSEAKLWKEFFNLYYRMDLPIDGDWSTPEFNNTLKKYFEEKGFKGQPDSNGLLFTNIPMGWTAEKNRDLSCAKKGLYNIEVNNPEFKQYHVKFLNGKYYFSQTNEEITDSETLGKVTNLQFRPHISCLTKVNTPK